jgi:hypothetical protein
VDDEETAKEPKPAKRQPRQPKKPKEQLNPNVIKTVNSLVGEIYNNDLYNSDDNL